MATRKAVPKNLVKKPVKAEIEVKNEEPGSFEFSFGIKLNFVKKKKNKNLIKLIHDQEGHNKFYNIEFLKYGNSPTTKFTVRCAFGRVGNNPQFKNHGFTTEKLAREFMDKKLKQELKKGYREIK